MARFRTNHRIRVGILAGAFTIALGVLNVPDPAHAAVNCVVGPTWTWSLPSLASTRMTSMSPSCGNKPSSSAPETKPTVVVGKPVGERLVSGSLGSCCEPRCCGWLKRSTSCY